MAIAEQTQNDDAVKVISNHDSPRMAANRALAGQSFYIVFDLQRDDLSVAKVALWISDFRREYYLQLGTATVAPRVLPTILIFADQFSLESSQALRALGAILFDRSVPSNRDCLNFSAWLHRKQQRGDRVSTPIAVRTPDNVVRPDLEVLNSDPPGVSPIAVDDHLRRLND